MSDNWFETWFDSPYYHMLYCKRDEQEAEFFLKKLLKELSPAPGASIADIPCGKGRHAIYLNRQGFDVTGLDLSPQSILEAQTFSNETLHFAEHDMRQVYKEHAFDIILNLFTSFGYFDQEKDNIRVLQAFHRSLKKNGWLVIDFLNPDYVLKHMKEEDEQQVEDVTFRIKKQVEGKCIIKDIDVCRDGTHSFYQEKVQLLRLSDFKRMMQISGFRIFNLFGSYTLDSFDEKNSERLIIKAQKTS